MHRLDRSPPPDPETTAWPTGASWAARSAPARAWAARAALLGALAGIASGFACGSDPDPEPAAATADAGPACEPGTENCACIGGSGCREELLCIARRCLVTDREEQVDPTRPSRPPPRPPPPAPAVPPSGDAGAEDASTPAADASAPEPDAPDAASDPG